MSQTRRAEIVMLLADGFEEAAVGVILTHLRQQGLAVKLVGLRSRPVNGAHGLTIVPDYSLDRLLEGAGPLLAVILPAGPDHLNRLRLDPRVGSLLQHGLEQGSLVVGLSAQATALVGELVDLNDAVWPVLQPEPGVSMEDFAAELARRLVDYEGR